MREEPETRITLEEYRRRVRSRLEVGKTYKLWETVHSDEIYHAREKKRVQISVTVMGFYPNTVHFRKENGINECMRYDEAYRMLSKHDGQGDD